MFVHVKLKKVKVRFPFIYLLPIKGCTENKENANELDYNKYGIRVFLISIEFKVPFSCEKKHANNNRYLENRTIGTSSDLMNTTLINTYLITLSSRIKNGKSCMEESIIHLFFTQMLTHILSVLKTLLQHSKYQHQQISMLFLNAAQYVRADILRRNHVLLIFLGMLGIVARVIFVEKLLATIVIFKRGGFSLLRLTPRVTDLCTSLFFYRKSYHNVIHHCSICCENFIACDIIGFLKCRHYFHDTCIQTWIDRSNTCPLCRRELYKKNKRKFL